MSPHLTTFIPSHHLLTSHLTTSSGLGDIIFNSITSVQSTALLLHKAGANKDGEEEEKEKEGEEKEKEGAEGGAGKKVISRSLSSLTTSLAPLKLGTFDPSSSKQWGDSGDETDVFQQQMAERRKKYDLVREKRAPKAMSRNHSLFLEEGSDLDDSSDEEGGGGGHHHHHGAAQHRPFSGGGGSGSHSHSHSQSQSLLPGSAGGGGGSASVLSSVGQEQQRVQGVRDIAHMTPEEIQTMLDELADDASLVSISPTDHHQHPHPHHSSQKKKDNHHHHKSTKKHSHGHHSTAHHPHGPVRKQRFKDLIWGRAAQHMAATSQQMDPLMKLMREEAELLGAEMMEDQFGERYSRKSRWEGVEHARQQERRRAKADRALKQATALL